jgi:uncharacterized membrane protein YraQ (UPF0718 family)
MTSSGFSSDTPAAAGQSQQVSRPIPAGDVQPPDGGRSRRDLIVVGVFLLIVVALTFIVKWQPLFIKTRGASVAHTFGKSIVAGTSARAPKGWQAALTFSWSYAKSVWQAVVLGLVIAAGVQEAVPRDWLLRLFGRPRSAATLAGGLTAVPSMMCTCCSALPTVTLARSRASVGATLAYWLGNPVLNPAVIVIMGFVLGWRWAVLRIAVGLVLVFGVATLAQRFFGEKDVPPAASEAAGEALAAAQSPAPLVRRYFTTLFRLAAVLLPEYAVIVLVLGAVRAFLFPAMSPSIGHALWLVVVLVITGTLFVIPTAGEIPIIKSFMSFGLGAAGAGALMITLPAVSLPSLVMVGRAVPARVLVFVAGCVAIMGFITAGLAVALGL